MDFAVRTYYPEKKESREIILQESKAMYIFGIEKVLHGSGLPLSEQLRLLDVLMEAGKKEGSTEHADCHIQS